MAKHASEIIAFHLGTDMEYVADGQYQPSVYRNPSIYVVNDDYYCAPTARQKLPGDYEWKAEKEWYGRMVYCAVSRSG